MDWKRLLRRFDKHERVLFAHLILFGYIYPCEKHIIPQWVMDRLIDLIQHEPKPDERICWGTNISQKGYGNALREWGFADGRLHPHGPLTDEQLKQLPEP